MTLEPEAKDIKPDQRKLIKRQMVAIDPEFIADVEELINDYLASFEESEKPLPETVTDYEYTNLIKNKRDHYRKMEGLCRKYDIIPNDLCAYFTEGEYFGVYVPPTSIVLSYKAEDEVKVLNLLIREDATHKEVIDTFEAAKDLVNKTRGNQEGVKQSSKRVIDEPELLYAIHRQLKKGRRFKEIAEDLEKAKLKGYKTPKKWLEETDEGVVDKRLWDEKRVSNYYNRYKYIVYS